MSACFIVLAFGVPILLCGVALAGAIFSSDDAEVLDLARSPQTEAELETSDIEQMLAAQNRYRRLRGAPERSLEDVIAQACAEPALGMPRF